MSGYYDDMERAMFHGDDAAQSRLDFHDDGSILKSFDDGRLVVRELVRGHGAKPEEKGETDE